MGVICFIVISSLLLVFIALKEKVISPIIVFLSLWSFIMFLSCFNLYGMIKPSNESYILLLLMVLLFSYGYFFGKKVRVSQNISNPEKDPTLNQFVFKLLFVFAILFSLLDSYLVIRYFMAGYKMWEIRNWTLQSFGSSNPMLDRRSFIEELFRTIVIEPFKMLVPPIASYSVFNYKSREFGLKIAISSVILLFLSSLSGGGGRLVYLYYVGVFLVAYFVNRKSKMKKVGKLKKKIRLIAVFAIVMVVVNTSIRAGMENLFRQIYTYFALPPTLLSIWLEQIKNMPNTYGLLTTFGFHSYFFRGLSVVGLNELVPQVYNISYDYIIGAEKFMNIGSGVGNAFVTPIYYFYLDGGIFFIIIASFIFGACTAITYKKIIRQVNLKSFCNYCLIIYGVFISFMRIQTAIPSYIISFILVSILFNSNIKIRGKSHDRKQK